VLGVLALPVLLAGVGLATVRAGRRGILLTVTVALVAFCLLALASVGLYYAPAAVALVIAVGGWRPERDPTSSG
jgi:cytochrome c-type biogenesis protein CcmH/NrfG